MILNWQNNDYFSLLLHRDKRSHAALEMLVDDLHAEKEKTISKFLCHSGSEDFLWGLVRLLGSSNTRVAGNSAYIIGTLAESDLGCYRVISLLASPVREAAKILPDLTHMLTFDDSESVMNAAGTMGTLAESHEGRMWMLGEECLLQTLTNVTALLRNDNLWTASNAALVLARLTIAEEGCERILAHRNSEHILTQLSTSLGVDEAGRGMNAAFAIGRLCDMEWGRNRLLSLPESEKMITSLTQMLCCSDAGASKNACFALSCLATNKEGHSRLLKNSHSEEVLKTLGDLLSAEDAETGWFAAMTLRTLASQPKGCLRLRDHSSIIPALKAITEQVDVNQDLMDEVSQTVEILKRLEKAPPPTAEVQGAHNINITWTEVVTKSGFPVRYHLYEDGRCVYQGREVHYQACNLKPHTHYAYRVRAITDGDEGPLSDVVTAMTEEATPSPVQNLRVMGATTTQLKVGWDPPEHVNGVLRGYCLTAGKASEHTNDLTYIFTGLIPNTTYEIQVAAQTSKGKGPKESVVGTTSELGAHAPSKPEVIVRGRNELHVSWRAPEVPLGRITRYDLLMDGEAVYSGTELHKTVHRLQPNKEYLFQVVAMTSEGKCESKTTKRRTAKDGFDGDRAPLYQPPSKKEPGEPEPPKPSQLMKKRKSLTLASGHQDVSHAASKLSPARTASASSSKSKKREKTPVPGINIETVKTEATKIEKEVESPKKDGHARKCSIDVILEDTGEASRGTLSARSRTSRTSEASDHSLPRSATAITKTSLPKPRKYALTIPKNHKTNSKTSKSMESVNHAELRQHSSKRQYRRKSIPPDEKSVSLSDKKGMQAIVSLTASTKEVLGQAHSTSRIPTNVTKDAPPENNMASENWNCETEHTLTARRSEGIGRDLAQTFTSIRMGTHSDLKFKPRESQVSGRLGLIDLDPDFYLTSHKPALPPILPPPSAPLQRSSSNILISTNRSGLRRNLEKLNVSRSLPQSSRPWKPDFPAKPQTELSQNKFVPMQLRTQPANLPTSMHRQVSNLAILERGQSSLRMDQLPRQSMDIDLRNPVFMYGPSYRPEGEAARLPLPNNGRLNQPDRFHSGQSTTSSASGSSNTGNVNPPPPPPPPAPLQPKPRNPKLVANLTLSKLTNETPMQSAR